MNVHEQLVERLAHWNRSPDSDASVSTQRNLQSTRMILSMVLQPADIFILMRYEAADSTLRLYTSVRLVITDITFNLQVYHSQGYSTAEPFEYYKRRVCALHAAAVNCET